MKREERQPFDLDSAGFGAAGFNPEAFNPGDECLLTIDEWKDLIAAYLYEIPERLDVRLLWSEGGSAFCRVNVWHQDLTSGANRIYRSMFVALDDTPDGPRVRDLTGRRAA